MRSVSSYNEFIALKKPHLHAFAKTIMVPLKDEFHREVSDLLDQIFTDRDVIGPDEPELWSSHTDFIKQPLERLFDFGFSFFLLDEQRDVILHSSGMLKPESDHMELKVRHFFLVQTHGCFQLNHTQPLHRFSEQCIANFPPETDQG